MQILIAESKTMNDKQVYIPEEDYLFHRPLAEETADKIMSSLRLRSQQQLAEMVKISPKLAGELQRNIYEFPNKTLGLKALLAYTGVVFRFLNPATLTSDDISFASDHLMIVSSLYGLLRPGDIIKPYRLDYTSRVTEDGETLCNCHKQSNTETLLHRLRSHDSTEILDLMPGDALRCFNLKKIKKTARIIKVEFRIPDDNGGWKTPYAGKLKELRGLLLREIIKRKCRNATEVAHISTDSFLPLEYADTSSTITFVTA